MALVPWREDQASSVLRLERDATSLPGCDHGYGHVQVS